MVVGPASALSSAGLDGVDEEAVSKGDPARLALEEAPGGQDFEELAKRGLVDLVAEGEPLDGGEFAAKGGGHLKGDTRGFALVERKFGKGAVQAIPPELVDVVGEGVGHLGVDVKALVAGGESTGVDPITEELRGKEGMALGAIEEEVGGVVGQRQGMLNKAVVVIGVQGGEFVGLDGVGLLPLVLKVGELRGVLKRGFGEGLKDEKREGLRGIFEEEGGPLEGLEVPLGVIEDEDHRALAGEAMEQAGKHGETLATVGEVVAWAVEVFGAVGGKDEFGEGAGIGVAKGVLIVERG